MTGRRSDQVAALLLALVPAVLFAPALTGGVFFQRDIHAYWQPQVETLVRVMAEGAAPLWDPYEGFGLPLLADPSHQVLYPPTWLNFLLLPPTVYKVLVLGHAWAAAVGTFLLARASGLSRPHFYRLFRTQTGVTPNLYLNTLIMEQALDALVATEVPIADIGFDLGFSSQSGFTRFFAANVGMAPTEYRRAAKVLRP